MDKLTISPCFSQLDNTLQRYGINEPDDRAQIRQYCQLQQFTKQQMLHQSGEFADQVFFICSGLVRFFYLTEDGKEHNKSFAGENTFVGAVQYANRLEPCRFYIQALEPTQTLAISLSGLNTLYQTSLSWANFGRLYMESLAVKKITRESQLLLDSAEDRYLAFLNEQPQLAEKLPLYRIASYLGITDVALSRIRKRLKS